MATVAGIRWEPPVGRRSGGMTASLVAAGCVLLVLAALAPSATIAPLLVGSAIVAISLPILLREATHQGVAQAKWVLVGGLALKLAGAIARYFVAFGVYGGVSDAVRYGDAGRTIATSITSGSIPFAGHTSGTGLIELLAGFGAVIAGPSLLASFLLFAWLGFWGQYLFYRAFAIGVPEGRLGTYAKLVFFLPSLAFWPSSVGKEAPMLFGLGLATYGAARLLAGRGGGLVWTVCGVVLAGAIRPHVAALFMIGLGIAWLVHPSTARSRVPAWALRIGIAVLLIAGAVLAVQRTQSFLQDAGISTDQGINGVFTQTTERTGEGGSEFTP